MANAQHDTISAMLRRHWEPTAEMLRRAIEACPEEVWTQADGNLPVWEHAFHAVMWMDAWLRVAGEKFEPAPFHCDAAVAMKPEAGPVVSREQMREYLKTVVTRRARFMEELTDAVLLEHDGVMGDRFTRADRLLGQIRHVQHHVGCMSAILRRRTGTGVDWVGWGEQ
jgi:hypothetical protein